MAKQYKVPYLLVRVARSPMNIQVVAVMAHEVFLLSGMFDDVSVVGRALDSQGRQQARTVDANEEYQRLIRKYGTNPDTDKSRAEEVYGPPFSKTWTGALDVDLEQLLGEEVPEPPVATEPETDTNQPDKTELLAGYVVAMRREDPGHANGEWWTGGGKPELSELKRRAKADGFDLQVSARDRDAAVKQANEVGGGESNQAINVDAVQARLDDLGAVYDPDDTPTNLVNQLRNETVSQIEALGGTVAAGETLEAMSQRLDELRTEQDVA